MHTIIDSIDPNITFDIIENYLPELKEELIEMLRKVDYEQELLEKVVNTFQYSHLKYLLRDNK